MNRNILIISAPSIVMALTALSLPSVMAASVEFHGTVNATGSVQAGSFTGGGGGLTNIPLSALSGISVMQGQVGDNAVTAAKLANGAITPVKIGFYGKTAVVAKIGGDYPDPGTAAAAFSKWCGTPTEVNRCLLKIMPGVYDVGSSSVVMQPFIDIEGSGENTTIIQGSINDGPAGTVNGASNAEIRYLTVHKTGGGHAIYNSNASPKITNVTANASGGGNCYGIVNVGSSPVMTNVIATASGGTGENHGVNNQSAMPVMTNVIAEGTDGTFGAGVCNVSSSHTMNNVTARGTHYGVYNANSSPVLTDVSATALGTNSCGIFNQNSSTTMNNSRATGTGFGVYNEGSGEVRIYRSTIGGATNSLFNGTGVTTRVAYSQLERGTVSNAGSVTCMGAYNANFDELMNSCQPFP